MTGFQRHFLLSLLALGALADKAPAIDDNPKNVVAVAHFPQAGEFKEIIGSMKFFSTNGTVKVHWDVTKLPKEKGPFLYHIHEFPVNEKQSCEIAGYHFNPYKAPAECAVFNDDSLCQVGDLSGKHGRIDTTCFEGSYYDPYLSLKPGDPSYIVGKSVVLHFSDQKKIACANIVVSPESVKDADLESKRNVLHNNDLVEAKIPGWKPANKEEAKVIEESHKEWLKKHKPMQKYSVEDEDEFISENLVLAAAVAETVEDEQDSAPTESIEEGDFEFKEPTESLTYTNEPFVSDGPEDHFEEEDHDTDFGSLTETTDWENNATDNILSGFGFLVSGLAGFLGFLI